MNRVKILSVLTLLILLSSIQFVNCWDLMSQTGSWKASNHNYWEIYPLETWGSATLNFTKKVENFTYWYFELSNIYVNGYGYWVVDQDIETLNKFIIEDENKTHKIEIILNAGDSNFFGWHETHKNLILYVDGEEKGLLDRGDTFRVWVVRLPNDEIKVQMRSYLDGSVVQGYDEDNINFGASWFNQVVLTQYIDVWGMGEFECHKFNEVILANEYGEESSEPIPSFSQSFTTTLINYVKGVWNSLGDALPKPVKDFII